MWMPNWIYERLPLLYLAAAVSCLIIFGRTAAAGFSALLFGAAAALTLVQRRRARTPTIRRPTPRAARR